MKPPPGTVVGLCAGVMLVGLVVFAAVYSWGPTSMSEEERRAIQAQPTIELWGQQARLVRGAEVDAPFVVEMGDGGAPYRVTPANANPGPWVQRIVVFSVWTKGDEAAVERYLERVAREAYERSISRELQE